MHLPNDMPYPSGNYCRVELVTVRTKHDDGRPDTITQYYANYGVVRVSNEGGF